MSRQKYRKEDLKKARAFVIPEDDDIFTEEVMDLLGTDGWDKDDWNKAYRSVCVAYRLGYLVGSKEL